MKITERMHGDHNTFRKMMAEVDALMADAPLKCDRRRLIRLVELFADHLLIHSWGEDRFYYSVVRQAVKNAGRSSPLTLSYMETLEKEHRIIDNLIGRLEQEVKTDSSQSTWVETYALFCRNIINHMKKEEEELFPLSEKLMGKDRLEKLSFEMERHRAEAPKARFHLSDPRFKVSNATSEQKSFSRKTA